MNILFAKHTSIKSQEMEYTYRLAIICLESSCNDYIFFQMCSYSQVPDKRPSLINFVSLFLTSGPY